MTGEQIGPPVTVAYGPYRLFRWRDAEGKTRTHYLGKLQPTNEEVAATSRRSHPFCRRPLSAQTQGPTRRHWC